MDRVWITNGSTRVAPVVNPLAAACEAEYVPSEIYVLDNPAVSDITDEAVSLMKTTVTAYGENEPEIVVEQIEDETDFDAIIRFLTDAIPDKTEREGKVAVDVTPGRKFWSIISFRAGITYDADHLYYLHVKSDEFFGRVYTTIPRPGVELIDFTEVV